jgi:DNA-directed RNA polymerase subunit RPC12/RpoP
MDLFTILCTTCKSRLKVRDHAAIGQILACPKCGGMVMVKPPPSWSDGLEAPSELPTVGETAPVQRPIRQTAGDSAFDAVDELLSDSPPKVNPPPAAASQPPPPRPRFVGGPPSAGAGSPDVTADSKTVPLPTKPNSRPPAPQQNGKPAAPAKSPAAAMELVPALPPPPPAEMEPVPPTAAAGMARPGRFWLLLGGSVVAGIVLAVGAVAAAIQFYPRPITQTPKQFNSKNSATPLEKTSPAEQVASSSAPKSPATPTPATPLETPAVSPAESTARNPATPTPPPSTGTDPLGLVQEPKAPAATASATDQLAKFDRLLSGDDPPKTAAPSAATATMPPATGVPPADPTPNRPVVPRPPPREVSVGKRLSDPLQGIETSGTPLADFLQFISDLSTIPITLEPDTLAFLQKTADSPVTLKAANTTVGDALAQALRPLGLEAVEMDKQLVVRPSEAAVSLTYPMKDLAGSEESLTELAGLLQALVEPASWGEGKDQGTIAPDPSKGVLAIRQRRSIHATLVFLCEKLRVARGKPPASSKFDAKLFKTDTRWSRAKSKLDAPISLNYSQPTRLTTVLDRLREASGVRILVDWRDVAAAGWNPDGEAILVSDKQPLAAALDALLSPMDLAWRVVDGQILQVVTPARLAERAELELYRVQDLSAADSTGEALIARLHEALGPAIFRDGGGNGELRFDPEGKCLLASLPQPKQRELEALLGRWRDEAKAK